MKLCLNCNTSYHSDIHICSNCNKIIKQIDSFNAFAPELALRSEGFKSNYFSDLVMLEEGNFWFRSRNKLMLWALRKYINRFSTLLEIGCGTGYVLRDIASNFPNAQLFGSEIFIEGLKHASPRLPTVTLMQMDARHIPYKDEFDVICAFDVLEHIKEDEAVLHQINRSLHLGGHLIMTVPQHQWLWSAVDEHACHVRRYSANDLHNKIRLSGFELERSTSFVSLLLPAMIISRLSKRLKKSSAKKSSTSELCIPSWLNTFFFICLQIEMFFIKLGINFAAGGSRLLVAKKIHNT